MIYLSKISILFWCLTLCSFVLTKRFFMFIMCFFLWCLVMFFFLILLLLGLFCWLDFPIFVNFLSFCGLLYIRIDWIITLFIFFNRLVILRRLSHWFFAFWLRFGFFLINLAFLMIFIARFFRSIFRILKSVLNILLVLMCIFFVFMVNLFFLSFFCVFLFFSNRNFILLLFWWLMFKAFFWELSFLLNSRFFFRIRNIFALFLRLLFIFFINFITRLFSLIGMFPLFILIFRPSFFDRLTFWVGLLMIMLIVGIGNNNAYQSGENDCDSHMFKKLKIKKFLYQSFFNVLI